MTAFLNPSFIRSYQDPRYASEHAVSNLGYMAAGLIATARLAFDNDTSGVPMDQRGIETTLEIAENILGDLIDAAELKETAAQRAQRETVKPEAPHRVTAVVT